MNKGNFVIFKFAGSKFTSFNVCSLTNLFVIERIEVLNYIGCFCL